MKVRAAQLPAEGGNHDRVFVGERAVVVLDGASDTDQAVTVAEYVDALGARLIKRIDSEPQRSLRDVVTGTLAAVVAELGLVVGHSPASTIAAVRDAGAVVEVLVLCDSPVYVRTATGTVRVFDSRLADLVLVNRSAALARLAAGSGFDGTHRQLLGAMRVEKEPWRNVSGGYWVAEADPRAGEHAIVRSFPAVDVAWCAILTDGADDPLRQLGIDVESLADLDEPGLAQLLARLHAWERDHDPQARLLPRYKRHDDKTVAVVEFR